MENKQSLTQKVYNQMLQNISTRVWQPGNRLPPEKELAQTYGVSRITIREAIRQLVSLGLLKTTQGSGTYVCDYNPDTFVAPMFRGLFLTPLSKKHVLDMLNLRMFETVIAEIAARKATDEDIKELTAIHREMVSKARTREEYVKLDIAFHMQICKMTRNPMMYQFCQTLFSTLEHFMPYTFNLMGQDPAIYYHAKLLDTISKHYSAEARLTMEEHLLNAIRIVESEPETSDIFKQ